ncbi:MAG: 50S ribosomal protein L6 [Chlorobi bacterium]|nr:50S ribosomal protein L6 [Chlorobiota bacterium]
MSRIGFKPVEIPEKVKVEYKDGVLHVSGPLGELSLPIKDVEIEIDDEKKEIRVNRLSESKHHKSMHGLYRSLIYNMVKGVAEGWTKELELVGVGYQAKNQGQLLELALGYSHNIIFEIPPEVKVETFSEKGKNPRIKLTSHDKQLVGQIAAKIRSLRKPEPYKGKGVRYVGEEIRRKQGKTA